jgi:hypothetical protein
VRDRVRSRLSYANAMSTIAVFVALGGTSYAAITLPRDSVGKQQIKSGAVTADELRRGAVGSRALKNRSITLVDLSRRATRSLAGAPGPAGPPGPPGVTFRAVVGSDGGLVAGNAETSQSEVPNKRHIGFDRELANCVAAATLARNGDGPTTDPGAGRIVATVEQARVVVETFTADGTPRFLPFNLIVAC